MKRSSRFTKIPTNSGSPVVAQLTRGFRVATIRLTQAAVEKLSPPTEGRAYYWDRHLPGFGLRVTPNGAKSWIASYRLADGRKVMETCYPRPPAEGRGCPSSRARAWRGQPGGNPVADKRSAASQSAGNTIQVAADGYLSECDRNLKPKTAREWRRIFEHDVLPRWGGRRWRKSLRPMS